MPHSDQHFMTNYNLADAKAGTVNAEVFRDGLETGVDQFRISGGTFYRDDQRLAGFFNHLNFVPIGGTTVYTSDGDIERFRKFGSPLESNFGPLMQNGKKRGKDNGHSSPQFKGYLDTGIFQDGCGFMFPNTQRYPDFNLRFHSEIYGRSNVIESNVHPDSLYFPGSDGDFDDEGIHIAFGITNQDSKGSETTPAGKYSHIGYQNTFAGEVTFEYYVPAGHAAIGNYWHIGNSKSTFSAGTPTVSITGNSTDQYNGTYYNDSDEGEGLWYHEDNLDENDQLDTSKNKGYFYWNNVKNRWQFGAYYYHAVNTASNEANGARLSKDGNDYASNKSPNNTDNKFYEAIGSDSERNNWVSNKANIQTLLRRMNFGFRDGNRKMERIVADQWVPVKINFGSKYGGNDKFRLDKELRGQRFLCVRSDKSKSNTVVHAKPGTSLYLRNIKVKADNDGFKFENQHPGVVHTEPTGFGVRMYGTSQRSPESDRLNKSYQERWIHGGKFAFGNFFPQPQLNYRVSGKVWMSEESKDMFDGFCIYSTHTDGGPISKNFRVTEFDQWVDFALDCEEYPTSSLDVGERPFNIFLTKFDNLTRSGKTRLLDTDGYHGVSFKKLRIDTKTNRNQTADVKEISLGPTKMWPHDRTFTFKSNQIGGLLVFNVVTNASCVAVIVDNSYVYVTGPGDLVTHVTADNSEIGGNAETTYELATLKKTDSGITYPSYIDQQGLPVNNEYYSYDLNPYLRGRYDVPKFEIKCEVPMRKNDSITIIGDNALFDSRYQNPNVADPFASFQNSPGTITASFYASSNWRYQPAQIPFPGMFFSVGRYVPAKYFVQARLDFVAYDSAGNIVTGGTIATRTQIFELNADSGNRRTFIFEGINAGNYSVTFIQKKRVPNGQYTGNYVTAIRKTVYFNVDRDGRTRIVTTLKGLDDIEDYGETAFSDEADRHIEIVPLTRKKVAEIFGRRPCVLEMRQVGCVRRDEQGVKDGNPDTMLYELPAYSLRIIDRGTGYPPNTAVPLRFKTTASTRPGAWGNSNIMSSDRDSYPDKITIQGSGTYDRRLLINPQNGDFKLITNDQGECVEIFYDGMHKNVSPYKKQIIQRRLTDPEGYEELVARYPHYLTRVKAGEFTNGMFQYAGAVNYGPSLPRYWNESHDTSFFTKGTEENLAYVPFRKVPRNLIDFNDFPGDPPNYGTFRSDPVNLCYIAGGWTLNWPYQDKRYNTADRTKNTNINPNTIFSNIHLLTINAGDLHNPWYDVNSEYGLFGQYYREANPHVTNNAAVSAPYPDVRVNFERHRDPETDEVLPGVPEIVWYEGVQFGGYQRRFMYSENIFEPTTGEFNFEEVDGGNTGSGESLDIIKNIKDGTSMRNSNLIYAVEFDDAAVYDVVARNHPELQTVQSDNFNRTVDLNSNPAGQLPDGFESVLNPKLKGIYGKGYNYSYELDPNDTIIKDGGFPDSPSVKSPGYERVNVRGSKKWVTLDGLNSATWRGGNYKGYQNTNYNYARSTLPGGENHIEHLINKNTSKALAWKLHYMLEEVEVQSRVEMRGSTRFSPEGQINIGNKYDEGTTTYEANDGSKRAEQWYKTPYQQRARPGRTPGDDANLTRGPYCGEIASRKIGRTQDQYGFDRGEINQYDFGGGKAYGRVVINVVKMYDSPDKNNPFDENYFVGYGLGIVSNTLPPNAVDSYDSDGIPVYRNVATGEITDKYSNLRNNADVFDSDGEQQFSPQYELRNLARPGKEPIYDFVQLSTRRHPEIPIKTTKYELNYSIERGVRSLSEIYNTTFQNLKVKNNFFITGSMFEYPVAVTTQSGTGAGANVGARVDVFSYSIPDTRAEIDTTFKYDDNGNIVLPGQPGYNNAKNFYERNPNGIQWNKDRQISVGDIVDVNTQDLAQQNANTNSPDYQSPADGLADRHKYGRSKPDTTINTTLIELGGCSFYMKSEVGGIYTDGVGYGSWWRSGRWKDPEDYEPPFPPPFDPQDDDPVDPDIIPVPPPDDKTDVEYEEYDDEDTPGEQDLDDDDSDTDDPDENTEDRNQTGEEEEYDEDRRTGIKPGNQEKGGEKTRKKERKKKKVSESWTCPRTNKTTKNKANFGKYYQYPQKRSWTYSYRKQVGGTAIDDLKFKFYN